MVGYSVVGCLDCFKIVWVVQTPLIFEVAPITTICLILGGLLADMRNTKTEIRDIKFSTSQIASSLVRLGQDFRELRGRVDVGGDK